jgi:hypothetical protein
MAIPDITLAFFDSIEEDGEAGWVVRVSLAGSGFESRAYPLVAEVGDVPVEGLAVRGDGGAVGFLGTVPAAGASLRIGYVELGLNETDITFPAQPNA